MSGKVYCAACGKKAFVKARIEGQPMTPANALLGNSNDFFETFC